MFSLRRHLSVISSAYLSSVRHVARYHPHVRVPLVEGRFYGGGRVKFNLITRYQPSMAYLNSKRVSPPNNAPPPPILADDDDDVADFFFDDDVAPPNKSPSSSSPPKRCEAPF